MSGFASVAELMISLLFIIALAVVSIRLLGKKALALSSNRYVRVVAAQSLGQNKSLHTVIVDEKTVLLVGVGTHVELVARFDDEQLAEKLAPGGRENDLQGSRLYPSFSWLISLWKQKRTSETHSQDPDFGEYLRERFEHVQMRRQDVLREKESSERSDGAQVREDDAVDSEQKR